MSNLTVRLSGIAALTPTVTVNGETVTMKRNQFGTLEGTVSVENSAELAVFNYHELSGRLWILFALLFYFISLFGIFNPRYDRKCIALDCKFLLTVQGDTAVNLVYTNVGETAFELNTDCTVQTVSNVAYVDKSVKKRLKLLFAIELVLWVALIVGVVFIVKSII